MKKLLKTVRYLRSRKGCPWDRKQTISTLRRCLLEEAHEAIDAIERKDYKGLKEELGDLLCVITMLSTMAEEKKKFRFQHVVNDIRKKLRRRHPHVFDNHRVRGAEHALQAWTDVKRRERAKKSQSRLDDVSSHASAFTVAQKMGRSVSRVGFDWKRPEHVLSKVEEEVKELRRSMRKRSSRRMEEELGDVLFTVAQLARKLGLDGEVALHRANKKFRSRFEQMEDIAAKKGIRLEAQTTVAWERLWQRSKRSKGR